MLTDDLIIIQIIEVKVTLGFDLSWNDPFTYVTKAAVYLTFYSCSFYFTLTQFLTLYKAQVRPCLKYGSYLSVVEAFRHYLTTLDGIQR